MTTMAITPLRQRMIEDMSARKLCVGTQRGHIRSCKRFAAFLKRSPITASLEDIRRFQLHLADTGVSICNRNRIMTGLRLWLRIAGKGDRAAQSQAYRQRTEDHSHRAVEGPQGPQCDAIGRDARVATAMVEGAPASRCENTAAGALAVSQQKVC